MKEREEIKVSYRFTGREGNRKMRFRFPNWDLLQLVLNEFVKNFALRNEGEEVELEISKKSSKNNYLWFPISKYSGKELGYLCDYIESISDEVEPE